MNRKELKKILDENKEWTLFVGPREEKKISETEQLLGLPLPESYKWFLREFGYGGVASYDIIGIGLTEIPAVVTRTKKHWEKKLIPKTHILIMDIGADTVWCIDTSQKTGGNEFKVVEWIEGLSKEEQPSDLKEFDSFFDFFETKMMAALSRKRK